MDNLPSDDPENNFRKLKKKTEQDPLSFKTWSSYGTTALELGKNSEALYAFQQALAIENQYIPAIAGAIATCFIIGKSSDAQDIYEEFKHVWNEYEIVQLAKQNNLQQRFPEIRKLVRPWELVLDYCNTRISFLLYVTICKDALKNRHELYYPILLKLSEIHYKANNYEEAFNCMESYETACINYTGSYDYDKNQTFSQLLDNASFFSWKEDSVLHQIFNNREDDWLSEAEKAIIDGDKELARDILDKNLSKNPTLNANKLYRCAIAFFELGEENSGLYHLQLAYDCNPDLYISSDYSHIDTETAFANSISDYFDHLSEDNPSLYQTIELFLKK